MRNMNPSTLVFCLWTLTFLAQRSHSRVMYLVDRSGSMNEGNKFAQLLEHVAKAKPDSLTTFTSSLGNELTGDIHSQLSKQHPWGGTAIQESLLQYFPKLSNLKDKYVEFYLVTDAEDSIHNLPLLKREWNNLQLKHAERTGGGLTCQSIFIGTSQGCRNELKQFCPTIDTTADHLGKTFEDIEDVQQLKQSVIKLESDIDDILKGRGMSTLNSKERLKVIRMKSSIEEIQDKAEKIKAKNPNLNIDTIRMVVKHTQSIDHVKKDI